MSAPLLFMGLPLVAAPVLFLVRRWPGVGTALAVLLTALLALLAVRLPLEQPVAALGGMYVTDTIGILGRPFAIEPADRLALAFMFAAAALLFLVSGVGEAPDYFLPAGVGMLGLLAAALLVRPFLFAALFVELAAAAAVLMLVAAATRPGGEPGAGDRPPASRGALRYLVYTTLALPFILLTGWLLEALEASPGDPTYIRQATVLLMFGFAVLLAVAPFHSWLPAIAEHAPPFAAAFVFSVMRLAVVFLLLTFLNTYSWLRDNAELYRALTVGGGGMALVGAVLAFGQRNFGRSLGYLMLVDIGAVMLGIGLGTRAGVEAALAALALRCMALPLWAMGLDELRRAAGADDFDALSGCARRHPVAAAAVVVGFLSMAGFPLTVGFAGRWALLRLLAEIHPTAALFLLLGVVSGGFVAARGLAALLTPVGLPGGEGVRPAPMSRLVLGLYGTGFSVVLVLGLFPQWLLPTVASIATAFSGLGP